MTLPLIICTICHEPIDAYDNIVHPTCPHIFHTVCFMSNYVWCPICFPNQNIPPNGPAAISDEEN